ncbi:MAG: D-alanyl-D-alanine carboxypeptidase [Sphingobium sp.]|nr:D-alanyl-D-alanine carboxypeptidase [Sphingobium sp.]
MKPYLKFALALPLLAGSAALSAPSYQSNAPVAYMIDLASGRVLYDRDGERRMPPASMAKMMTAHVAFKLIKEGRLKLSQTFPVREETWRKWNNQGSTMFLAVNAQVSVENLLHGIVTLSGNDACVVLAEGIAGSEEAFTDLMNAEAKRMGLTGSHFGTSNGWPDEGRTYVTAHDLALLAKTTIEETPELYKQFYATQGFTWGERIGGGTISQDNRNPILGKVDGADGLKTGHTEEAGYGFTGSAIQNGRRLVMVVAGLPTYGSRIDESERFMNWGFRSWRLQPLFKKGATVAQAQVQGGWTRSIDLVAPRDLAATLPASALSGGLNAKVVYDGPLQAPIAKGQVVAHLVVTADGDTQSLPLASATDVSAGGFFARMWTGFLSLFS